MRFLLMRFSTTLQEMIKPATTTKKTNAKMKFALLFFVPLGQMDKMAQGAGSIEPRTQKYLLGHSIFFEGVGQ